MFLLKKMCKRATFASLALVFLTSVLFVSCPDPNGNPIEAEQPTIISHPQGGTFDVGAANTFGLTVAANVTDGGTLSYQWYSNTNNSNTDGTATGTSSATLTLNKSDFTANGNRYFYVIVTNTLGTKTATAVSNVATVQINGVGGNYLINAKVPVIESLVGGTWDVGEDDDFELTVAANVDDDGTLSYQWYKNTTYSTTGGTETGTNSATLTLDKGAYTKNDAYYFYVVVTNTYDAATGNKTASATSNVATVQVNGVGGVYLVYAQQPNIGTQPAANTAWDVSTTDSISLTVAANVTDGGTLSYQWYLNTPDSNNSSSIITGKTAATLTLNKADYTENDTYHFYVRVANTITDNGDGGSKTAYTISEDATVTVTGNDLVNAQQPGITGQPAAPFWNVFTTGTVTLTVDAASNDGGTLSYQWYSNATNSTSGGTEIGTDSGTLTLAKANYATNGIRFFYVVVTNTNNNVVGNKTAVATSTVARVTVVGNPDTSYTESPMPEDLKGTWQSSFGEEFVISGTEFTSSYGEFTAYAGTVVGHRSNGDAGYITIQYTENGSYAGAEGKYYVIHYTGLTSSAVSISGAYLGDDPDLTFGGDGSGGKATQAEAEATFTLSAGYFSGYSDCVKMGGGNSFDHPLKGEWRGSPNSSTTAVFTITDENISYKTISSFGGSDIESFNFTGEIVKVENTDAATGYMVFRIILGTSATDGRLDKYSIVEWTNYNESAGTVTLGVGGVSSAAWGGLPVGQVKDSIEEAEEQVGTLTRSLLFTRSGSAPANAAQPSIATQPSNRNWDVSTTNSISLTVGAITSDGGTLSYQWYANTTNSTTGGTATGTNSTTLTLNKANYTENDSYYFYVSVTNTNNNATGSKTATITSNVATVTVSGNAFVLDDKWIGFWYDGPGGYGDGFMITEDYIGYDMFGRVTSPNPNDLGFGWVGKVIGVEHFNNNPEEGIFVVEYFGSNGWGTSGKGNFTCFYFKYTKTTSSEGDWYYMLNLAFDPDGGSNYGQPMWETPEEVIETCTLEYLTPQLMVMIEYCKAP